MEEKRSILIKEYQILNQNVQKVINYFSFSGLHPLVGLKNIQYLK